MARNLTFAGHDVAVWNRTTHKATEFSAETGFRVAQSSADLMAKAEVVLTMLADDTSSEQVHYDPDGLFAGEGAKRHCQSKTG